MQQIMDEDGFFWETFLQWWSNILSEWHSEQAQCANLGHRKSQCYRAAHSWLPKSLCVLWGLTNKNLRPFFLLSVERYRIRVFGHAGKLAHAAAGVRQWEIYLPEGWCSTTLPSCCSCIWTCWKIGSCSSWSPTVRNLSTRRMVLHPTSIAMFVNF